MCLKSLVLVIQLPFCVFNTGNTSSLYPAAALASGFHSCYQCGFSLGTLTSILRFCLLAAGAKNDKELPIFRDAIKPVATRLAISLPGLQLVCLS
jgi:hypothetical protein